MPKAPKQTKFQLFARVAESDGLDKDDLDVQAHRHGLSVNELIIRAVKEYIKKLKGKEPV
jgi:predicted HicB family RNase H-like nuclease